MAPEYALHGYLTEKTDIFSYGILVLEIVSGRKNHDELFDEEKADLLSYVSSLLHILKTETKDITNLHFQSQICFWVVFLNNIIYRHGRFGEKERYWNW